MSEKFLKNGIYLLNHEDGEPDYAVVLNIKDTTYQGKPVKNYQLYTFDSYNISNKSIQETLSKIIEKK